MAKHVSTNPQISWIWVELNRLFHLSSQHCTLSSMLVIKTAWVGLRNYGLAWILCFGRHNRRWRWCDFSWKIYTVSLARKTAANFCGLLKKKKKKKKTPTFDATKTNGNIPSCPLKYPLEWVKLELVDGQMSGCGDADTVPSTSICIRSEPDMPRLLVSLRRIHVWQKTLFKRNTMYSSITPL